MRQSHLGVHPPMDHAVKTLVKSDVCTGGVLQSHFPKGHIRFFHSHNISLDAVNILYIATICVKNGSSFCAQILKTLL